MLSKNRITLPKTIPVLCRAFVLAVAPLRTLRMSPGAVLNIAPFITALLGVVRKEAFDSRLDDCTPPLVLKPTADPFRQLNREFGHQSYSALS
jgi:hypothetical protein